MAHTPGPWSVIPEKLMLRDGEWLHVAGRGPKVLGPDENEVARLLSPRPGAYAEADANARLIAAAPDMLATLRGCADALAEAGKSFALSNPLAARPNLYELHARAADAAIAKAEGR